MVQKHLQFCPNNAVWVILFTEYVGVSVKLAHWAWSEKDDWPDERGKGIDQQVHRQQVIKSMQFLTTTLQMGRAPDSLNQQPT